MSTSRVQDLFIHLAGQDDNLGDSALRLAYLNALRGPGRRVHIYFGASTPDYESGFALTRSDRVYTARAEWLAAGEAGRRPVHFFNAGEINPPAGLFPNVRRTEELRRVVDAGAPFVAAGFGMKDPSKASVVEFDSVLREAAVISWRDELSRHAAGFGDVTPDWAYSLGTSTSDWASADARPLLAVTLRFDRPWPGAEWIEAVRALAAQTSTRIVTVAQVARDAPRAVRLAKELGGEYLMPRSMDHAALDRYARRIFGQSRVVVSDRAHGLIIAASEGAYPIGSAGDPQKIHRLLATAGLGDLVGRYDELPGFSARLNDHLDRLAPAVEDARRRISGLTTRIHEVMDTA
ncbi:MULTISPECIES: polysaccharide pyruvyl transferase family protein [unclassified Microbacterium]|uniref:polysaccharide pyruvyl transferase family protein n=1 Tax=unclassified Microbacterium TaxID=2609290 RepID=UPI003018C47E